MRALAFVVLLSIGCRGAEGARAVKPAGETIERGPAREVPPAYPGSGVRAQPLAERLGAAIHGLPARRHAACCQEEGASTITGECVRALSAALADGSVVVRGEELDACVAASATAFA